VLFLLWPKRLPKVEYCLVESPLPEIRETVLADSKIEIQGDILTGGINLRKSDVC
jgi:hypothetical protein